jgi:hypothetical protein
MFNASIGKLKAKEKKAEVRDVDHDALTTSPMTFTRPALQLLSLRCKMYFRTKPTVILHGSPLRAPQLPASENSDCGYKMKEKLKTDDDLPRLCRGANHRASGLQLSSGCAMIKIAMIL